MKLAPYLFWIEPLKKMIWDPFWWLILFLIILWVPFLRVWWWVFLPVMLCLQLKTLYLWWLGWDFDYAKVKWIILEITPPREILIPLKAMEDVFSVAWTMIDHANFRELWCDGELKYAPYWCSWEIASIEGNVHFYLRAPAGHRTSLETALYAHYPDLEIKEVADYTKLVPPTVPEDEWDIYGEDYDLKREDAYPIKTYEKFFEPQGERIAAEEKRLDPIIALLELLSRLGPGENYWVQFITAPINDADEPEWRKEGTKIVNKIAQRPEKKKSTLMQELMYLARMVVFGAEKEGSGEGAKYSWAPMEEDEDTGEDRISLTPGERDIITEVEKKMSKPAFRTTIRGVYVAKRENWKSPHRILMRSYMAHFGVNTLNYISFNTATRPRIHYFLRKRRVFLRARKMFRFAVLRFPGLFPDRQGAASIFSAEEMATMYHFPLRVSGMVSPSMSNVESKKAGPPPNLPVEE